LIYAPSNRASVTVTQVTGIKFIKLLPQTLSLWSLIFSV